MKQLLTLLFIGLSTLAYTQDKLWQKPISEDAFIKQLDDGKIFVKDEKKISLFNNESGEKEWSSNVETKKDPLFLDNLPLMYFEGNNFAIIDASSGDEIINETIKTEILDIHYKWDQARILFEISQDKITYIYNLDLKDVKNSWKSEVGKTQSSFMGLSKRGASEKPSISDQGELAIIDKKFIVTFDKDGNQLKKIEFEDDIKKQAYNVRQNILYVLEDKKLHYVNIASGEIKNTIELKEKDLDLLIVAEGKNIIIKQKKDILTLNALDGEEVGRHSFKDDIEDIYMHDAPSKYIILSKKLITEIDQNSGMPKKELTTEKNYKSIDKEKEDVFVSTNGNINILDIESFKLKFKEPISIAPVTDYIDYGTDRLYIYTTQDKRQFSFVNSRGKTLWKTEFVSINEPTIDEIAKGLLIITDTEAMYLNMKDGKSKWKKDLNLDPSSTFDVNTETNTLGIYSDKRMYFIDLKSGKKTEGEDKIIFKDFDYDNQKPQIFASGKGFFIKGSNSINIVGPTGKSKYSKDYKQSNNSSGLLKLANTAFVIGAIGTGNMGKVVTVYHNGDMVHKGSMVDDLNSNWAYADEQRMKRQQKQNES